MSDRFASTIANTKSKMRPDKSVEVNRPNAHGKATKHATSIPEVSSGANNKASERYIPQQIPMFVEDQPNQMADQLIQSVRANPVLLWGAFILGAGWLYIRTKNN